MSMVDSNLIFFGPYSGYPISRSAQLTKLQSLQNNLRRRATVGKRAQCAGAGPSDPGSIDAYLEDMCGFDFMKGERLPAGP